MDANGAGPDLQLLTEIRDSLRLLPNEIVLRMERSRGSELLRKEKKPEAAEMPRGTSTPPPQPSWYDAKSDTGKQIEAFEKMGFALGRVVPELGQLASFSQSIRGIFDAWENLGTVLGSVNRGRDEIPAPQIPFATAAPEEEPEVRRGVIEDNFDFDISHFGKVPPAWTYKHGEGVQSDGGGLSLSGKTPLPPIPGLQRGPEPDEGSGPGPGPRRDTTPLPDVTALERALGALGRQEKAQDKPSGMEDVLLNLQRQAMGWSGGEAGERGAAAIGSLVQQKPEAPTQEQRDSIEIMLSGGKPAAQTPVPQQPEPPAWTKGIPPTYPLAGLSVQMPASVPLPAAPEVPTVEPPQWARDERPAAIGAAMGRMGGASGGQWQEAGRRAMGAPGESVLSGAGAEGVAEVAALLKAGNEKSEEVVSTLKELVRTLEKSDGDEDQTENVENLPPSKREGPTQFDIQRQPAQDNRQAFGALKALAGGNKKGSGLGLKEMFDILKFMSGV